MDSIRCIYKIGNGPSSSHTMGPQKAASLFKSKYPDAHSYRVTLYGSLAATGKGHLTDKAIIDTLAPAVTEVVWRTDIVPEYHTNGMLYEALDKDGQSLGDWMVYSIGGGNLSEGPNDTLAQKSEDVYPISFMNDILAHVVREGLTFWEYIEQMEDESLWPYLEEVWNQMQKSIEEGLENDHRLPGCIKKRSLARQYHIKATSYKTVLQGRMLVTSYALAVSEQNARGGVVVTAPTCGSCGVLPAVLYHLKKAHDFTDEEIIKALATAALFGNVIKTNASISGAEVGCQGEIGSACVMAAVAATQLFGGTDYQIECAAEMAMEHNLGLTCDPICGLVQIPCIERNPIAALRALDVSLYSLLGDGKHLISFDKVVDTMKRTGKDIPSLYKETSMGGLATD